MSLATRSIKIDGSLNIAGGMSAQKNIYASSIASSNSAGLYPELSYAGHMYSGIMWKKSYYMGLYNEASELNIITSMPINSVIRNSAYKASALRGDMRQVSAPPFYFVYWKSGQSFTLPLNFYSSNVTITNATTSSNTTSGAIVCSGGMGVSENVNVGGTLSVTGNMTNPTTLSLMDGLNQGIIDQLSTELTLSSSGNKVAISTGNQLVFKDSSSNTYQLSAYRGREVVDNVHINTLVKNYVVVKQTTTVITTNGTLVSVSGGNLLFSCLGTLYKGQVIRGCFYYLSAAGTGNFGLYLSSTGALVANSSLNTSFILGWNYIPFTTAYIVPTTQVYHLCINIPAAGPSAYSLNTSSYLNYGFSSAPTTLARMLQYSNATYSSLPSSAAGITCTTSSYNIVCGVWNNFELNVDPTLLIYLPFENSNYANNCNKYFIDGSTTNILTSITSGTGTAVPLPTYSVSTSTKMLGTSSLYYCRTRLLYNGVNGSPDYFSYAFWSYSTNTSTNPDRVVSMENSLGGFMVLSTFSGNYNLNCDGTIYKTVNTLNAAYNNTWIHWVLVVNGTNVYIYKNGTLSLTSAARTIRGGTVIWWLNIGLDLTTGNPNYLDDFRIYNKVLSDQEIQDIYSYRGNLI